MVPLSPTSPVWGAIATDIEKSFGQGACIISIEEVRNPKLESAFEARRKEIDARCHPLPPVIIRQMYHGTSGVAAEAISAQGFDPNKNRHGV